MLARLRNTRLYPCHSDGSWRPAYRHSPGIHLVGSRGCKPRFLTTTSLAVASPSTVAREVQARALSTGCMLAGPEAHTAGA